MWGALRNAAAIASEQAQTLTSKGIASATQLLEKLDGQLEEGEEEEFDGEQQDRDGADITGQPDDNKTGEDRKTADVIEKGDDTIEGGHEISPEEKKKKKQQPETARIFSLNNVLADLQENFVKPLAAEVFDQGNADRGNELTYEELQQDFNEALEHIGKIEDQVESLKAENEKLKLLSSSSHSSSSSSEEIESLKEENRRLSVLVRERETEVSSTGRQQEEDEEERRRSLAVDSEQLRAKNSELIQELQVLREKYNTDVARLTNTNEEVAKENDALAAEVKHLKELVEKHRNKKTSMTNEINTLKRDLEKEKADTEDVVRTFRDQEQDFINSIAKLRDDLAELTNALSQEKSQAEHLQGTNTDLQQQVAGLESQLDEEKRKAAQEESQSQRQDIEAILQPFHQREKDVLAYIQELRDSIDSLTRDLNKEKETTEGLREQLETAGKMSVIRGKLDEVKAMKEDLKSDVTQTMQTFSTEMAGVVHALTHALTTTQAAAHVAPQAAAAAAATTQTQTQETSSPSSVLPVGADAPTVTVGEEVSSPLAEEVSPLAEETSAPEQQEGQQRVKELEGQVDDYQSTIALLEHDIEELKATISSYELYRNEDAERLNAINTELEDLKENYVELSIELERSSSAVAEATTRCADTEARLAEANKRFEDAEVRLSELSSQRRLEEADEESRQLDATAAAAQTGVANDDDSAASTIIARLTEELETQRASFNERSSGLEAEISSLQNLIETIQSDHEMALAEAVREAVENVTALATASNDEGDVLAHVTAPAAPSAAVQPVSVSTTAVSTTASGKNKNKKKKRGGGAGVAAAGVVAAAAGGGDGSVVAPSSAPFEEITDITVDVAAHTSSAGAVAQILPLEESSPIDSTASSSGDDTDSTPAIPAAAVDAIVAERVVAQEIDSYREEFQRRELELLEISRETESGLMETISVLQDEVRTLSHQLNELKNKNTQLEEKAEYVGELNLKFDALKADIVSKEEALRVAEEAAVVLRDTIISLETRVEDLSAELATAAVAREIAEDASNEDGEASSAAAADDDLQNTVSSLEARIQELSSELEESKADLDYAEAKASDASSAAEELQRQVNELTRQLSDLSVGSHDSLAELTSQVDQLQLQVDNLSEQLANKSEALDQSKLAQSTAEESIAELHALVDDLNDKLTSSSNNSTADIDALHQQVGVLTAELDQVNSALAESDGLLKERTAALAEANQTIDDLQSVEESLRKQVSGLETELSVLREERDQVVQQAVTSAEEARAAQVSALTDELTALAEQREEVSKQLSEATLQLEEVSGRLSASAMALQRTEEAKHALEVEREGLLNAITEADRVALEKAAENDRLDGLLQQRIVDSATLHSELRELTERVKELEAAAVARERMVSDLTHQLQQSQEEGSISATDIRTQLEAALEEVQFLRESSEKYSKEANHLRDQLTTTKNALKEVQAREAEQAVELANASEVLQRAEAAEETLARLDEKKRRDLENLKKQNERIAQIQREKAEIEQSSQEMLGEMKAQLDVALQQVEHARLREITWIETEDISRQRLKDLELEVVSARELATAKAHDAEVLSAALQSLKLSLRADTAGGGGAHPGDSNISGNMSGNESPSTESSASFVVVSDGTTQTLPAVLTELRIQVSDYVGEIEQLKQQIAELTTSRVASDEKHKDELETLSTLFQESAAKGKEMLEERRRLEDVVTKLENDISHLEKELIQRAAAVAVASAAAMKSNVSGGAGGTSDLAVVDSFATPSGQRQRPERHGTTSTASSGTIVDLESGLGRVEDPEHRQQVDEDAVLDYADTHKKGEAGIPTACLKFWGVVRSLCPSMLQCIGDKPPRLGTIGMLMVAYAIVLHYYLWWMRGRCFGVLNGEGVTTRH